MDEIEFGRLKRMEPIGVWASEPDFSDWLATEVSRLGEAMGIDIDADSVQREASVGALSADITCFEVDGETRIIIENQVGRTDHDHLGKVITYAAGFERSSANQTGAKIIWIGHKFRDEHLAALEWLNEKTDDNTIFFGIEVDCLQIDDSKLVPNFSLVAKPNDWSRSLARDARDTPSAKLHRDFWEMARLYVDDNEIPIYPIDKNKQGKWLRRQIEGKTYFVVSLSNPGSLKINLHFEDHDGAAGLAYLDEHIQSVKKHLVNDLIWKKHPGTQRLVMQCRSKDFDLNDKAQWAGGIAWFCDNLVSLDDAFKPTVMKFRNQVNAIN